MSDAVDFHRPAIPDELLERDQWMLWDASADRKQPFTLSASGGLTPGSWTDPDDWLTFDRARRYANSHESVGIGFVFAASNDQYLDGLIGALDLDGCVEERGRPVDWLPDMEPFVDAGAYAEYSPSGEGIHIPLVGFEPPEWWSNVHKSAEEHEGVEAYGSKFFTVTGDQCGWAGDELGRVDPDVVNEWLAEAYENLTGEDPREQRQQSPAPTRETQKDRTEVEDMQTTTDYDDVLDAVDHLEPGDLPLRSTHVEDENQNVESWDPGYRQSQSGTSLKRWKDTGLFIDMAETDRNHSAFGPLRLFAAEEGIIRRPWDRLQEEDWHEAVDRARESGAPIPEFVGEQGDVPDGAFDEDQEVSAENLWLVWSDARTDGSFDEESHVPTPALRYVAREKARYDMDPVPDDRLPWGPHNAAVNWIKNVWGPRQDAIDTENEAVTATQYKRKDPDDAFTWDDVRRIYDDSKEDGRYAAVTLLRRRHHFLTPEDTEELHIYEPELGIYDGGATHVVGRKLDRNLRSHYSQHEKKEILGRLKERKVERDELEAGKFDGNYVCVKNGVLDLDERTLQEHSPEWLFTTRLPVEYDPDLEPTRIRKFLEEITRREADRLTMLEMLGNCLLDNYEYESFLVLFGEGSNGKSTWYEVVRTFLGQDNVSSMTLQQITDNRFMASGLVGKWANIGEDLPDKKIQDLGRLKDLTGGGETRVEPKGKDSFDFRNRAKMMFAANRPPVLGERTKAIKRRLLPIRLPYQFTTEDDEHKDAQKEGLVDDLTTDDELRGLLNLALDGLDRLRADGDFSLPETHDERLEYYEQFSDHIKNFAVNCLENTSEGREDKSTIYNAYTKFCEENNYEMVNQSVFWTQLRKTTLDITERRPSDNDRKRVIDNITFTNYGTEFVSEYSADPDASDELATLAPGDDHRRVEVRVDEIESDTPDEIAQKGTVVDATDEMAVTVWADANAPTLESGSYYRLKNVNVSEYDGHRELMVNRDSAIEEIAAGVGNAPVEDPGANDQLSGVSQATDGGQTQDASDGGVINLKPRVVRVVQEREQDFNGLVPHDVIIGALAREGEDPASVENAIENALHDGAISEPKENSYRPV